MTLDRPLGIGASGGHGPIRYTCTQYIPGREAEFTLDRKELSMGFLGRHVFEVVPRPHGIIFRHTIDMELDFRNWLRWKFLVETIHDAVIEDLLDNAEKHVRGAVSQAARWGVRVRLIRRWLARH